jgi:hypothetical protein
MSSVSFLCNKCVTCVSSSPQSRAEQREEGREVWVGHLDEGVTSRVRHNDGEGEHGAHGHASELRDDTSHLQDTERERELAYVPKIMSHVCSMSTSYTHKLTSMTTVRLVYFITFSPTSGSCCNRSS